MRNLELRRVWSENCGVGDRRRNREKFECGNFHVGEAVKASWISLFAFIQIAGVLVTE